MQHLWRLLRSQWPEILVLGIWLQSVISALFSGNVVLFASILLGGGILLVLIFELISRLRQRGIARVTGEAFNIPRRGLIFTVGGQPHTLRFALSHQKPVWVGFVCTMQSEKIANMLMEEFSLDDEHARKVIVDPWSIQEIQTQTDLLVRWLYTRPAGAKLRKSDIVIDVTGGLTPMSVGAFSVAVAWGIDAQYIRSKYDPATNRYIDGTQEAIPIRRHDLTL